MKALPPGQCQSVKVLPPDPHIWDCSLTGGHTGAHQYIRGSWPLIVWEDEGCRCCGMPTRVPPFCGNCWNESAAETHGEDYDRAQER